jgi:hypothetical protein
MKSSGNRTRSEALISKTSIEKAGASSAGLIALLVRLHMCLYVGVHMCLYVCIRVCM